MLFYFYHTFAGLVSTFGSCNLGLLWSLCYWKKILVSQPGMEKWLRENIKELHKQIMNSFPFLRHSAGASEGSKKFFTNFSYISFHAIIVTCRINLEHADHKLFVVNVVFMYTEIERNIRTYKCIWGSAKEITMERKLLGLEKSDIPASLRISKYLWTGTLKLYGDLPKPSVEKVQEDTVLIAWKSQREWSQFVIQINMYSLNPVGVSAFYSLKWLQVVLLLFPNHRWDLTGI